MPPTPLRDNLNDMAARTTRAAEKARIDAARRKADGKVRAQRREAPLPKRDAAGRHDGGAERHDEDNNSEAPPRARRGPPIDILVAGGARRARVAAARGARLLPDAQAPV